MERRYRLVVVKPLRFDAVAKRVMGWWWHLVSGAIEPLIELHSNGLQGEDYPKTQGPD